MSNLREDDSYPEWRFLMARKPEVAPLLYKSLSQSWDASSTQAQSPFVDPRGAGELAAKM
jgi:hypothetical protein